MNLKKIIFLIILIVVLVLGGIFLFKNRNLGEVNLPQNKEEVDVYSGYEKYSRDDWNFEIKYPKGWEQKVLEENETEFSLGLIAPQKDNSDKFSGNIIVSAFLPQSKDFNEFMDNGIKEVFLGQGISLIQNNKVSFSGHPAYLLEYLETTDFSTEFKHFHYFVSGSEKWYQVIYTAESSSYEETLDMAKKIINSIIIK